ncbi:MAG: hypothetical protein ACYSWU_15645 [Planctomycetota bacterium]|jgi:hypothetical protein
MASRLERNIRAKVAEFVSEQISLGTLHDWLVPIIWTIEERNDPEAETLVYAIELAIAEYNAGHVLECDFRCELESFVKHDNNAVGTSNVWISIGRGSTVVDDSKHEGVFSSSTDR